MVGGIGAGKSVVARILAESGAAWISADQLAHEAYAADEVRAAIHSIWGPEIFQADGQVDRQALARTAFADEHELRRLEMVIHPWIRRQRDRICATLAGHEEVRAFVADSPLLFEANLDDECECVVFVECRREIRARRLHESRGWTPEQLDRREARQLPLNFKRDRADIIVNNDSDIEALTRQVRGILPNLLPCTNRGPAGKHGVDLWGSV